MKNFTVLATPRSFDSADSKATQLLESKGCTVIKIPTLNMRENLLKYVDQADAIIAGLETYDKEMLEKFPKLKVISRYGVGYDAVDCAYAQKKGITVTITPGANGNSVSDLAVTLMLAVSRNISYMDKTIKENNYQRPIGQESWQKTVGVIGTGRIGSGVVRRCAGFDMKVLCMDVYKNQEIIDKYGAEYTTFDDLLKRSDYISIHTPLTPETESMFGTAQFKLMKKNAIIVNTARGGIINEDDLYEALKNNDIWGAGLDVTREGIPYTGKLKELDNCILTPHAGAATYESSSKMSYMAAENVLSILEGKDCKFSV
ncbi:MAG: phosphoglycerate dehydrogenase [Peptostreptococcaceae bacterium]|nr:phosphoglycerate dehydrogenase [Peptostreptococcaceae bacterium]